MDHDNESLANLGAGVQVQDVQKFLEVHVPQDRKSAVETPQEEVLGPTVRASSTTASVLTMHHHHTPNHDELVPTSSSKQQKQQMVHTKKGGAGEKGSIVATTSSTTSRSNSASRGREQQATIEHTATKTSARDQGSAHSHSDRSGSVQGS